MDAQVIVNPVDKVKSQVSQGLQITSSASALIFRNTTERLRSIRFPLSVQGYTYELIIPAVSWCCRSRYQIRFQIAPPHKTAGFRFMSVSSDVFKNIWPFKKNMSAWKKCKENLGKIFQLAKGTKKSAGGPKGALDLNVMGPAILATQPFPSEPWLWVPRQIPLFESGKHDHGPSCSSCPSLSMKEGMWFRAIFSLGFVSGHVTWNPTKNLAVLLSFGPLPCRTCLQQLISNARIDSTSRSLLSLSSPVSLD